MMTSLIKASLAVAEASALKVEHKPDSPTSGKDVGSALSSAPELSQEMSWQNFLHASQQMKMGIYDEIIDMLQLAIRISKR